MWAHAHKTTNAPLNLTALCIIFSGRIFLITRGNGPWNSRLFWAPNRTRLTARAISWASKKSRVPGPNPPRNEKNPPEKIMHGAVKFIGALIVKIKFGKIKQKKLITFKK